MSPLFSVDCEYSNWSEWDECSKQCGGGTKSRSRQVTREAWYGGEKCDEEDEVESSLCNENPCEGNIH